MQDLPYKDSRPRVWSPGSDDPRVNQISAVQLMPNQPEIKDRSAYLVNLSDRLEWMLNQKGPRQRESALDKLLAELSQADLWWPDPEAPLDREFPGQQLILGNGALQDLLLNLTGPLKFPLKGKRSPENLSLLKNLDVDEWKSAVTYQPAEHEPADEPETTAPTTRS